MVLISLPAYANCNIYLGSFTNLESGAVKLTKYDEVFESYRTQSLEMTSVNVNMFAFNTYGRDNSCSTGIYQGKELFSIGLVPYCPRVIKSSDLVKTDDGEYYSLQCANNVSMNILKKYDDSVLDVSIVPTGFYQLSFGSYIVDKVTSSTVAFKVNNISLPKTDMLGAMSSTLKDGYYRFNDGYGGYQSLLYNGNSDKSSSIDVYIAKGSNYTKLGSCFINMNKNRKLTTKCTTLANPKGYKIMAQYNAINVIDPNSDN